MLVVTPLVIVFFLSFHFKWMMSLKRREEWESLLHKTQDGVFSLFLSSSSCESDCNNMKELHLKLNHRHDDVSDLLQDVFVCLPSSSTCFPLFHTSFNSPLVLFPQLFFGYDMNRSRALVSRMK